MNICICCHTQLLRHLNRVKSYYFCPNCYQEMPTILIVKTAKCQHQYYIKNTTVNEKGSRSNC